MCAEDNIFIALSAVRTLNGMGRLDGMVEQAGFDRERQ